MQKRKKNTFTQAKVLRENEIVIVRLPNKSCDLICLKINNPRWASNAVSGVSLQVQHLQEAINLALASEIAPLAPLAPLLHNPDRSRSARRREASPWSRHVWFVLEGEGGGGGSVTLLLCVFLQGTWECWKSSTGWCPKYKQGWESHRSWRKFLLLAVKELVPSANGFLNRQIKGTINAENIGTNLKLRFIVHLIAHEYWHKTDSTRGASE